VTCRSDRNESVKILRKVRRVETFLLSDPDIHATAIKRVIFHSCGTIKIVIRISRAAVLCALCATACRGAADRDASAAIRGGERIGWTQAGSDVSHYRFVLYVDGGTDPKELPDARCSPAGAANECEATLPKLPPGKHQVQVGAQTMIRGQVVEGTRSAPFTITVADPQTDRPR
jgi:hypothetical protein